MVGFTALFPWRAADDTRPLGSEELLKLGAAIGDELAGAITSYEDEDYPAALATLERATEHLHQLRELMSLHIPSST
jgi:hypothetical protein